MGYVVWRFIQAFLDPEHNDSKDFPNVVRRIAYGISGFIYAGIAYSAIEILTESAEDGSRTPTEWVLIVMSVPLGRLLVTAGGLMFFGVGCYYFYRAFKAEFRKRLKLHHMSDAAKIWCTIVGRSGIAARGFVYIVIGTYATSAAWEYDPDMIKCTEGDHS